MTKSTICIFFSFKKLIASEMLGNKKNTQHFSTHTHTPKYSTTSDRQGCLVYDSSKCWPYLQQFDALRECSSVEAGLAARSIDVAFDSVVRLAAGLVEGAQVHPGGGVVVVQLNSTNVSLQCVHRLVLLLVEHPGGKRKGDRVILLSTPRI